MDSKKKSPTPRRKPTQSSESEESWFREFIGRIGSKVEDISDRTIRIEERTGRIDGVEKKIDELTKQIQKMLIWAGVILTLIYILGSLILRFVFSSSTPS